MEFGELFDAVLADLTVPEGVGVSEAEVDEAESAIEQSLPVQLRKFYSCVGAWSDMMEAFHRFRAIDELEIDDEHLVFVDGGDEEDVCWGVRVADLDEKNPRVFNGAGLRRDQFEWRGEPLRLSEFLVVTFLNQALGGGLEFAGFGESRGRRIRPRRHWIRRGVNGPLSIFSRKEAVLGLISDPRRAETVIYCASRSEALLETSMQELEIEWEKMSADEDWED